MGCVGLSLTVDGTVRVWLASGLEIFVVLELSLGKKNGRQWCRWFFGGWDLVGAHLDV